MKFIPTLFISIAAAASLAWGQEYKTLSGYRDKIVIPADQTAFIVSATEKTIIEIEKSGERARQYEFFRVCDDGCCQTHSYRPGRMLAIPSMANPTPIAGPVTLILRTEGLVTISLPAPERRSYLSTSNGPRAFAKN